MGMATALETNSGVENLVTARPKRTRKIRAEKQKNYENQQSQTVTLQFKVDKRLAQDLKDWARLFGETNETYIEAAHRDIVRWTAETNGSLFTFLDLVIETAERDFDYELKRVAERTKERYTKKDWTNWLKCGIMTKDLCKDQIDQSEQREQRAVQERF